MSKKIADYINQNFIVFFISLFYVSFGGIVACSLYPSDPLNGDWWFFGWLFTFPVNIFSTTYRFTEKESSYTVVIIIQTITFVLTFLVLAKLTSRKK
jgi:hypothetical protein